MVFVISIGVVYANMLTYKNPNDSTSAGITVKITQDSQPTTTFHHQGLAGNRFHPLWLELGRTVAV